MLHLKDINMTYFEHLFGALGYSYMAFKCSIIFLFHGFFPDYCIHTGSDIIQNLNNKLQKLNKIIIKNKLSI